jgi:hypothetical protein
MLRSPLYRLVTVVIGLAVFGVGATAFARGKQPFKIPIPAAKKPDKSKDQQLFIKTVVDARKVEDRPTTADIPSLAAGLANTTDAVKSTAAARVRDGYGKARGNIFLEDGQTVEAVVKEALTNAFTSAGYTVVGEKDKGLNTLTVNVTIEKFWGWVRVNPGGGWAGDSTIWMDGELVTTIEIPKLLGRDLKFSVSGKGTQKAWPGVTPGNWLKVFTALLQDYSTNAAKVEF